MLLDGLAEARIEDALAQGALADLPGEGRPLILGDDRLVPEGPRVACRILKKRGPRAAGGRRRRELADLAALPATLDDVASRQRALARLAWLKLRLESGASWRSGSRVYCARLLDRLSGGPAR